MKISTIRTNILESEITKDTKHYYHPVFGMTAEYGIYKNPNYLGNFNNSKVVFSYSNGKIDLYVIDHDLTPHARLFFDIKTDKDNIYCKVDKIDVSIKTLIVNNYYNYPNYESILKKISEYLVKKHPNYKLEYIKQQFNTDIDYQCYR